MRNQLLPFATVVFLLFISLCSCSTVTDKKEIQVTNGNEGLNLTNSELEILLERAKKGDPEASLRLADYYEFYKHNYDEADVWLKKAAEAGNVSAQQNFAVMSLIRKNYETALYWFSRAAESDNLPAMVSLAEMYEAGQGTQQDFHKARYWYERAARGGEITGMLKMAEFLSAGKGGEQNNFQAYIWLLTVGAKIDPKSVLGIEVSEKRKQLSELLSPDEEAHAEKESEILLNQIK